ncbi:MAG: TfoX/Sxy family protein [Chloroflexota bacterium]
MPDQPARPASKRAAAKPAAAKAASKSVASEPSAMSAVFQKAKPDPVLLERVEVILADLPVYRRPMFGVVAWFVEENAQMLGCVWGDALNLRVGAEDAAALIASGKAAPFDPMGRGGMREYVLVPASTLRPAQLRTWLHRALAFTSTVARKNGK